jgi:hypothetical protein
MPEQSPDYSVILDEEGALRPADIARALSAERKVPFQDVMQSVRKCWGIVEEKAPKAAAEAAAAALTRAGVKARAVPSGLVEDLPPPQPLARLESSPAGLFHASASGGESRADWGRLALLGTAGFTVTDVRQIKSEEREDPSKKVLKMGFSLMTGLPTSMGLPKVPAKKTAETTDIAFTLDIILLAPMERLRVDASRFDFSCLKERMLYDVLGNFKLLLAELARAAPSATLNRGSRILLDKRPVREMGYDALRDMERECRWLLTLKALHPQ